MNPLNNIKTNILIRKIEERPDSNMGLFFVDQGGRTQHRAQRARTPPCRAVEPLGDMTAPTDLCISAPRAPMHALLNGAPSASPWVPGARADKTDKWARTAFQPCQRVGLAP